jgi:hypothetical protein
MYTPENSSNNSIQKPIEDLVPIGNTKFGFDRGKWNSLSKVDKFIYLAYFTVMFAPLGWFLFCVTTVLGGFVYSQILNIPYYLHLN